MPDPSEYMTIREAIEKLERAEKILGPNGKLRLDDFGNFDLGIDYGLATMCPSIASIVIVPHARPRPAYTL